MQKVYEIRLPDGRVYVGQSKDPVERLQQHKRLAKRGKGWRFHKAVNALNCYGSLRMAVLFEGEKHEANVYEEQLISKRILGGICLNESPHSQGGYYFTKLT